ncbi:MAG: UTP--glucose-1-phosphate uridylyltransferase GalU [Bdellovibrionales bacterium]
MNIRKAVIPAAGLGTRFLPATKSSPKEMLPIVDRPILLHIVEEVVAAGISEIVLIQGRHKHAIEDFFDKSFELEHTLKEKGQTQLLEMLERIRQINVITVRQKEALGLGHAVLCAAPVVGNEPFAVLLGDEIMLDRNSWKPAGIGQLVNLAKDHKKSVVAVMEVPESDVSKYGIIKSEKKSENLWQVLDVIEKPSLTEAPSRLALPGRYVFEAEIFDHLRGAKPGRGGEIQLTDAMAKLALDRGMLATTLNTIRFDAGDKFGFIQANIELGLRHPEVGEKLTAYLRTKFGGH